MFLVGNCSTVSFESNRFSVSILTNLRLLDTSSKHINTMGILSTLFLRALRIG